MPCSAAAYALVGTGKGEQRFWAVSLEAERLRWIDEITLVRLAPCTHLQHRIAWHVLQCRIGQAQRIVCCGSLRVLRSRWIRRLWCLGVGFEKRPHVAAAVDRHFLTSFQDQYLLALLAQLVSDDRPGDARANDHQGVGL